MPDLETLLRASLGDARAGWSMGSFGAIAEFHQDEGETLDVNDPEALTRSTSRGAIRLAPARLPDVHAIAYETLSPKPHRWSHALALCLPLGEALREGRSVLTEIGPDHDAIRVEDREAILFDMGLSLPCCEFCIRTADPALLETLRANVGRALSEPGNATMAAILKAHPHRVALTDIGRAEVFQKIGGPDTGGVSPAGPHTHVLPKLLASGRTHSANTPIPNGLVPLGYLHPGNPVIDAMGADRPFDVELHRAFQSLMAAFGQPELVAVKQHVIDAVAGGLAPEDFDVPNGRHKRATLRLALRQERRRAEWAEEADLLSRLDRWIRHFEPAGAKTDADDDAPGH